MRVIGLDISTTTIGRCVIDFNESKSELLHIDYYKPVKEVYDDKNIDFLHMVSKAKKDIDQLIKKYKPEYIAVEDYIRFMKGASGASTIIPLSCLNRTICLHVFEKYPKIKLNICNVISIRTSIKKHLSLEKLPEKKRNCRPNGKNT